ncbi:MAG: hypothetical protein ACT4OG_09755 [Alphaproteobacteria bacterium]
MRAFAPVLFLAASVAAAAIAAEPIAPPVWSAKWFFPHEIPSGATVILPRDEHRPPAVIGFRFKMAPPTGWNVSWTNNVQALGKQLTQEVARGQGEGQLYFRVDPCAVAGIDMPGTEIPVQYEFVFSATQQVGTLPTGGSWNPPISKGSFILRLDRDTVAPMINTLNAPSTAYRDQTIQVTLAATDISEEIGDKLIWDSGLHTFTLDGPAGPRQSGRQVETIDDSYPQRCADKVKKERHVFSYTIPHSAQPGDTITLRAEVVDWSGNPSTQDTVVKIVEQPKPDTPFPPRAGCSEVGGFTTYYQGVGGTCHGTMFVCKDTLQVACNAKWFWRPNSVMEKVEGPQVCCDDWRKARQSKKPCDVSIDSDCDGIRNSEDRAPGSSSAR